MLSIFLCVTLSFAAIAVLVTMRAGNGASQRVLSRLAALDQALPETEMEQPAADIRKEQLRLSAIPWLNQWLLRMNVTSACTLFLSQAGVTTTLGALLLMSVAGSAFFGYLLYIRSGDVIPALLLSVALLPIPLRLVQRRRRKRLTLLEQQLPEALGMIAGALRVGHSLIAGLGAVAQEAPEPIGAELRKCFEEQNYGVDLRVSLHNLTRRVPVQDFRIAVAAILIQRESGGNLAEVLEKVVQTSRDRFRLSKQVSVHTAQGRMTGWVLSLLPLVIGSAMYVMNPEGMSVLWKHPAGLKMLYAAAAMDFVGGLIIRKIVRIQV